MKEEIEIEKDFIREKAKFTQASKGYSCYGLG